MMDPVAFSCERCRKRKIKCDKHKPCSKCLRAGTECHVQTPEQRSRHPSKQHVEALQNRLHFLEAFINKVATTDETTRRLLLANKANWSSTHANSEQNVEPARVNSPPSSTSPSDQGTLVLAKARECRMRNHNARKATQFYGGTSLLQMSTSTPTPPAEPGIQQQANIDITTAEAQPFDPRGKTCRHLMAVFFQNVYQYNMCIYREWFLRDYAAGEGPYYSDALMYAICAVGALVSPDPTHEPLSAIFAAHAQALVLKSLDMPDLTILQALVLLGYLEVGQGRSSRGWLYCGMAFRLTHEMGLHLDPGTWTKSSSDSSVDREILRRVYWAVFVADKQLSLYFGRPPALYPHEADVRNTIRIPYPPEWESLLDSYISKGTSSTAFEDGISFIGAFIHQVELAKILHTMIVDVFENRRRQSADAAAAAESAQRVHNSLVRWHSMLPQKLHWSQWTVGKVPPYVLHLHMLFHTAMIILHRPPRKHLEDEAVIKSEGIEVCYESLSATLRLLKSYGRYYRFEVLPLDFVHTLSAAAEVVMMRKYMQRSSWDDNDVSRPMALILETMASVQRVFPCVREIRDSIIQIMEAERRDSGRDEENILELDLMDSLQSGAVPFPGASWCPEEKGSVDSSDLGLLVTDDFLNEPSSWGGAYTA